MGCGRVGASLAGALDRIGHEVAVIDRDSSAFQRLSPEFTGERVLGMGFDRDVLLRAGIEGAGAFAAVSSGDNSNIISARVARETFGVQRVVARIYDAGRAQVYERLGIPTVATVPWTTDRLLNAWCRNRDRQMAGSDRECRSRRGGAARRLVRPPRHRPRGDHRGAGRVPDPVRRGVLPEAKTVIQASDQVYIAAVSGHVAEAVAIAAMPPRRTSARRPTDAHRFLRERPCRDTRATKPDIGP
jgi:trk system potassium uptake protein TrkA